MNVVIHEYYDRKRQNLLFLGGDKERDGGPKRLPKLSDLDLAFPLLLFLLRFLFSIFRFLDLCLNVA